MYSTRSNASARKPFDFLQPPMMPKFGSPEDNSMGFGTLPSPAPTPEFMKERLDIGRYPEQRKLLELGYPLAPSTNAVIDDPMFPIEMESGLERSWKEKDQMAARFGGSFKGSSELHPLSNSANTARTAIPQNMDLFDELGSGQMIRQLPMSVLTGQGEQPVQPAQSGLRTRIRRDPSLPTNHPGMDYLMANGQGNWVPSQAPGDGQWKLNPNSPDYVQNALDEYNHTPEEYRRQVPFDQFLAQQPNTVNIPTSMMDNSQRTAAMQGVPMGANNGSIVNFDDFQIPQNQPMQQYQPMMQGGPMPYQGGMSGPHFQGQMQSMLGDLLSRQNMGRQYNDMAMARDGYDDAWDRARANFLNPLMGGLMGGNQIAAMQQDSNNRMNQIMDRRQLRRQAMNDQWGQTKDLVGMIAANDPQTLKNQNALAKLQMEMYQKAINQQNANTQQFGAQSNAQYRSRMADVAEQKGRVAESNLLRMIQEGADRSQRGWAQIEQNKAKWESSLEMRKMELEQRKQQAAASNDIRMMQLIQKDEADLADEEYKYAKISSDLEAKAAEVDKFGAPKRSAEFVDKYGTKAAPGKEPAQQPNQALDIINALGNLFQRAAGGNQPSAPGAAAPKPVPGKPQATSGGTKPITADVVRMLKAKYPNDMNAAMAEAKRLGYKVN